MSHVPIVPGSIPWILADLIRYSAMDQCPIVERTILQRELSYDESLIWILSLAKVYLLFFDCLASSRGLQRLHHLCVLLS